ncbi:unnamed protein product [Adineta ricciae]|uniref:NHL repeat containing protein n=1 Tax=Adineta ricciae TaxID=249248 RepID=A0A815SRW4_ADIRI|nr:unnamed protein product [Adineta ricciae]CAF1596364.1 unnamed protein product [Adineta ricciae]
MDMDRNQKEALNGYNRSQKRICLVFTTVAIALIVSIVAILLIPVMKNAMNVTTWTVTTATTEISFIITTTQTKVRVHSSWNQYGYTVTGGDGDGSDLNKLHSPNAIDIDDDGIIYVCDCMNHRIIRRRPNSTSDELVAGGNGEGKRIDQLNAPLDVIVDQKTNSLIICDSKNYRVVRWSLQNQTEQQIVIDKIGCRGLAIDQNGTIYVSEYYYNLAVVKRFEEGQLAGKIVAGGDGIGNTSGQLETPTYLFVDQNYSIYISDAKNNRIVKWMKGAKEGIVVGGPKFGGNSRQLRYSRGFTVDYFGNIYIVDSWNHRVVRWSKDFQGTMVVVGGYGPGRNLYELNKPEDVIFDRQGNLYVVDKDNHRVQKFDAED